MAAVPYHPEIDRLRRMLEVEEEKTLRQKLQAATDEENARRAATERALSMSSVMTARPTAMQAPSADLVGPVFRGRGTTEFRRVDDPPMELQAGTQAPTPGAEPVAPVEDVPVESRAAARRRQLENLGMDPDEEPTPGSVLSQFGHTGTPGFFEMPPRSDNPVLDIGLGVMQVIGAAFEPFIEPLDVGVEQALRLIQGKKPIGYMAALEDFRERSFLVQMAFGAVLDPFLVLGALGLTARASRTLIRSSVEANLRRTMPNVSNDIIVAATDDVVRQLKETIQYGRRRTTDPGEAAEVGGVGTGGELLKSPPRNVPYTEVRVKITKSEALAEQRDSLIGVQERMPGESPLNAALSRREAAAIQDNIKQIEAATGETINVRRYRVVEETPTTAAGPPLRASQDPRSLNFETISGGVVAQSKRTVSEITDIAAREGRSLTAEEIGEIRARVRSESGQTLQAVESRVAGTDLGPEGVPEGAAPDITASLVESVSRSAPSETVEATITSSLLEAVRRSNGPIDPPRTPITAAPGLSAFPPSGRPRTLPDLYREAKGLRALTPDARAAVMDEIAPLGEVVYRSRPYGESAAQLLGPDTLTNQVVRAVPGVRNIAALIDPAQVGRTNTVQMIGVRANIFKEIETARARFAGLRWWNDADEFLGFHKQRGIWRARKVKVAKGATTDSRTVGTINDLVEHPERYDFSASQSSVLKIARDTQTLMLRDAQRAGVEVLELSTDYWHRIVTNAPGGKGGLEDFIRGRLGSRKGHTMQRAFNDIDEGIELGYQYETHPLTTFVTRLEAGIETIANAKVRNELKRLPKVETAAQRRSPAVAEALESARGSRDAAIVTAKESAGGSNEVSSMLALRQAEADYVLALREVFIESRSSKQAGYRELSLPNGRIAPADLVQEIQKFIELPELSRGRGAGALAVTGDAFGVLRTTLTTADLASGYIQGQSLFYRNNVAWWRAQAHAIMSLVDDPFAYVERNFDIMDEGTRMGAIAKPTEFLFARQGIGSIPTKIPLIGPALKAFNRAFEWFILVGQTELYKAGSSKIAAESIDELVSLGSAIRKGVGTESYAILGVRPTQQTIESLLFFASRFLRANVGILGQAFTKGAGGAEARRLMGSLLAGGLTLTIGAHWAITGKAPNLTDPFAPDWMQVPIGKTYFNAFGPFYPYFRYLARTGVYLSRGETDKAAQETIRFAKSKASLPFRAANIAAELAVTGESRTFEGDTMSLRDPLSIARGILGEFAVPIAPGEIVKGLQEGRPEAIAEVVGLTGRSSPFAQMDILFQRSTDINPKSISMKDADQLQRDEMDQRYPEIAARILKAGRGKFGEARRQWADIDVANFKREEALGQEFQSGMTTGVPFRDAYSALQSQKRSEKAGVNAALGLFQEDRDLPDDPNERALAEFYRAQEAAVRESGIYDFEEAEKSISELDSGWTAEQKAYVDRNTGRATHPPLIQEFRNDVVLLKPFWDIRDQVVDGLPPADRAAWDLYNRDEINRRERAGDVSGILEHITLLQDAWIFDHAETSRVDVALLRWGYRTTPHSNEGAEFIENRLRSPQIGPPAPTRQPPSGSGESEETRRLRELMGGGTGESEETQRLRELMGAGQR